MDHQYRTPCRLDVKEKHVNHGRVTLTKDLFCTKHFASFKNISCNTQNKTLN